MTRRTARPLAMLALTATALAATGCDLAVDTPLGVEADASVVGPGAEATGSITYLDGEGTVTLAPFDSRAPEGHRSAGEQPCASDDDSFACPTDGLAEGLYVVQVTDAAQPGEGTATAFVAVTDRAGYDPQVSAPADGELRAGDDATLTLTGFDPAHPVRVRVVDERGRRTLRERVRPDADGTAVVELGRLPRGEYTVAVDDGLWRAGVRDTPGPLVRVGA